MKVQSEIINKCNKSATTNTITMQKTQYKDYKIPYNVVQKYNKNAVTIRKHASKYNKFISNAIQIH